MRPLIHRELRAIANLTMIALFTLVVTIVFMRLEFDFWNLNFMTVTLRPHLLIGLLGVWIVVAVEHVQGRESTISHRRSVALLPYSLHQIFLAKLITSLLVIGGVAVVSFGLEMLAKELFPIPLLDRVRPSISMVESLTFLGLTASAVLFFSTVVKGSGGSLAAAALFLGAIHIVFAVFSATYFEHWEVPEESINTILAVTRSTFAFALLLGSWRAFCRGELHRGRKLRPLVMAIPAVVLALCPAVAWGGFAFAELVDFSFDREDVSLSVIEVLETKDGPRVIVVAKRNDHRQVQRSLLFDPTSSMLLDLGVYQYPHAVNHRGDGIVVFDCTNSFEDQETYHVSPDGNKKTGPPSGLLMSRDFKLRPQPQFKGSRCFIAYKNGKRKLVVEDAAGQLVIQPCPQAQIRVFDNELWFIEFKPKEALPWQKKLVRLNPFTKKRAEYLIPRLEDPVRGDVSFLQPATITAPGQVLTVNGKGELVLLDLENNKQEIMKRRLGEHMIMGLASTWDGRYALIQTRDKRQSACAILEIEGQRLEFLPTDKNIHVHPSVGATTLSPDGRFILGRWPEPFVIELAKGVQSIRTLPVGHQGLAPVWIGPHSFLIGQGKKLVSFDVASASSTTLLDLSR